MPLGRRQCRGDRLALACGAHVDVSGHLDSSKELAGRGIEILTDHLHDVQLRILSAMLTYPRSYQPAVISWRTVSPVDWVVADSPPHGLGHGKDKLSDSRPGSVQFNYSVPMTPQRGN